jgi:hypothetical protein
MKHLWLCHLAVVAVSLLLPQSAVAVKRAKADDSEEADEIPSEPKQLEVDVFQATLLMSVSDDIVTATIEQSTLFQNNFLGSYNQLQNDPAVCDPFGRDLNDVVGYDPEFSPNSGGAQRTRRLQARMIPLLDDEEGDSFVIPESLRRQLQSFGGRSRNQTRVLLQVSGTCTDCSSDMNIFSNDVSNRRRTTRLLQDDLDLAQGTTCPPGSEIRTPTTEETVLVFNENNNASGLPYETTGIAQLFPQTCPAPLNDFAPDTYTFTLDLNPLTVPNFAFHDTMRYLTTEDYLSQYYNEFLSEGYCDPLYRYITQVDYVSSQILQRTQITYRIGGICRGCVDLFSNQTLPPAPTTPTEPSVRRRGRQQRKLSKQPRLLQEDQCWCASGVFGRPPTQAEFEEYLTRKFLDLSASVAVDNRLGVDDDP